MNVSCPVCSSQVSVDLKAGRDGAWRVTCPNCRQIFDGREQIAKENASRPGGTPNRRASGRQAQAAQSAPASHERPPSGRRGRWPKRIGPYEVLEEISRGGMGIVYKAQDVHLQRMVAIKVLLAGEGATDEDVQRFQREARAAARLQHSNIVPIHSVGEFEGKPFFVMDFVEGQTVKQLLEEGRVSPRLALSITKDAAEALDHAARQGVVHRDVKPANIIVDKFGTARIMDFGLAKRVDEDMHITQSGTTMGTPSYMAPEQAEGDLASVDARSDVYSLGAVLYEMLTGIPPFEGQTTLQVLRKVIEEYPVPPRKLNPRIHGDIETICLKCLEKEKERRYESGTALAEDIRRFNAGEPIAAVPLALGARISRAARKHLHITLSILAVAAFGLATLLYVWHTSNQAEEKRIAARRVGIDNALREGKKKLEDLRDQMQRLANVRDENFRAQEQVVRAALGDAQVGFQRVQSLDPENVAVEMGLGEIASINTKLEAERFLFMARSFLHPRAAEGGLVLPPNFQAAQAFAELALEHDAENAAAQKLRREAIGFRAVQIETPGVKANVAARRIAFVPGQPLPKDVEEQSRQKDLDTTPVRAVELPPGLYVLTFTAAGMQPQEATLLVSRTSDTALRLPLGAAEQNMVRIPAGRVSVPFQGDLEVGAFLIDRYEYPNRAGSVPKTEVLTLVEAKRLCEAQGKMLCSRAQWMRACMGDEQRAFPYGTSWDNRRCATGYEPGDRDYARPFASGAFPLCRTAEGVYDMSGNVSEWTLGEPSDEIVLGGDWTENVRAPDLTLSCRAGQEPDLVNKNRAGLRCCKSLEGPAPDPVLEEK
ncbi:MAG: protein kinase [Planctomycetes bacterium]|nr:protein kinase [Planctomycetota bacterium]